MMYFSNLFSGIATFVSVSVILWVYWQGKRNERTEGARVLMMEIRNAEKVISEIKNTGVVGERSFILPTNSWQKLQHLFIKNLDNDDLVLLNEFYNLCFLAQKEIDRMKSYLPISNEEKIKQTQIKLLELAQKHHSDPNNFTQGSSYLKEKNEILNQLFFMDDTWFLPNISSKRVIAYVQDIRFITTSSCGTKLKRTAKLDK